MNIQYNKKKQELHSDPLITFLSNAKHIIKTQAKNFIVSGVILVIIVAAFQIFVYIKKSNASKAIQDYGKAMLLYSEKKSNEAIEAFKSVVEKHPSTIHAAYSAFTIGQILLKDQKYSEAIPWFEKANSINTGDKSFIRGSSLEALGVCYEAKHDLPNAQKYFEKAINDPSSMHRHTALAWKLALIYKKNDNKDKVLYYCNKILADTIVTEYKQKAENLKVEADIM